MRLTLLFLIIQIVYGSADGQTKIPSQDSVVISSQIIGFYSWYFEVIKNDKMDGEFNPMFVRQNNGMTTLDFTNYRNGLRRHKFTDAFIERKVSTYKTCVQNLNQIPFDEFSKLTDLDDFENINCDFGNRYEFTGGMEPKHAAELINLQLVDKKKIIGHVGFSSFARPDGTAIVTFRKFKKEWLVEELQLE
jgi:hypothetical protein